MNIDIKPVYDFVHIEVDGIYEDTTSIMGPNGQRIKLAMSKAKNYDTNVSGAEERRTRSGIARFVCRKINDKHAENFLYPIEKGFPSHAEGRTPLAYNKTIEVEKGDKVYFHYLSLSEETFLEKTLLGTEIHAIRYKNIFCFVRDGKIKAINGHVLLEPTYEEEVEDIEVEGKSIKAVVTASGLIANAKPKKDTNRAKIAYIGEPVLPFVTDAKVGDLVKLGKHQNKKYTVEGKEYYISQQWKVLAKEVEGKTFPFANMVMVEPLYKKTNLIVDQDKMPIVKGKVLAKGGTCSSEYGLGEVVHFPALSADKRWDDGVVLVKEDQIYLVGEGDVEIIKEGRFVKV